VAAFLAGEVSFGGMVQGIERTVEQLAPRLATPTSLDDVFEIDRAARALATQVIT
jgi:1-deoxy-D-xylulose 5-phosphate reductoisomerase